MNGTTHQLSGIAATLSVTCFSVRGVGWVQQTLPTWLVPVFTPPTALGGGGSIAHLLTDPGAGAGSRASVGGDVGGLMLALVGVWLVGWLAGQFPDIDSPNSTISNSGQAVGRTMDHAVGGGPLGWLVKVFFWVFNLVPHTIATLVNHTLGHRGGFIHGPTGLLVFSLLVGWLTTWLGVTTPFYGLLFFVGYFTHLLTDSLTKSGIKWLWPLTDHSFHLLFFRLESSNPWHNLPVQLISGVVIVGSVIGLLVIP